MIYVFDLDGTLVDTKKAVIEAYRAAGVKMPEEAWGQPWRSWLKDERAHQRKNELYLDMLQAYARPLPLLEYALMLNAPVITGASAPAVLTIMQLFAPSLNVQRIGVDVTGKIAFLKDWQRRTWSAAQPERCYVDDLHSTRERVYQETRWQTLSPPEALARLSSPQAPTLA